MFLHAPKGSLRRQRRLGQRGTDMAPQSRNCFRVLTALVAGVALFWVAPVPDAQARQSPDGQLVFTRFDPALQDLVAITINPDGSGASQPDAFPMECPRWSPDGTRLASCGVPPFVDPNGAGTTILNVDTGHAVYRPFLPGLFSLCSVWSPNGQRLACDSAGIHTVRVKDWSAVRTVTTTDGEDTPGSYSPSGDRIVLSRFTSDPFDGGQPLGLFVVNADGTGLTRITPPGTLISSEGDWSPDGREIVFSQHATPDSRSSIWVVHPDGTGLHRLDLATTNTCGGSFDDGASAGCFEPVWSPSGTSIAFDSSNADGSGVWIADLATGQVHLVATDVAGPLDWGTHPLQ